MDVYVNGEPAGTWETATGNTQSTYHEVDVTGIEDLDALEQYFNETGIIPYEMVNGKKVYLTFAKLPQNNTAISASAVSDIVAIAGGSLVAGYNTDGMIVRLAKSTAFNAIMRAMYLTINGGEVLSDTIAEIESALDPFCITGSDDIPAYVDSNGVAYVLADAVEAVRDKLIAMGAYNEETEVPSGDITTEDFTVHINAPIKVVIMEPGVTYRFEQGSGYYYTYSINTSTSPVYMFLYDKRRNSGQIRFVSASPFSLNEYSSYSHSSSVDNSQVYLDRYPMKFNGYSSGMSSNSYPIIPDGLEWYDITNIPVPQTLAGFITSTQSTLADVAVMFGTVAGGGIEGTAPSASIPVGFGDITMPLPDVWPDWYARKKQVATPADDDLFLRSPALPLDVPVDNVFDDGYAGDSDQDTTGDLADILKQAIVDAIPDILDQIIADTAVTEEDVYRIPVDDGGNTPPPTPPVLDGSSNGLWTMYNPTKTQVNEFGAWLWSDTIIDQIIRQFNSPIDAIIGFHQIYCTPSTGAAKVIKAGYLNSPVSAAEVINQYKTIDCGTVHVDEFYGNVLDYDNSQVSVYLPFIGIVPLNTNVVMGSDLQIIYRIDVFTGTCLAQIKVIKENSNAVMYAFDGNCAVQIPLTATTYTGMIGALISGISAGVSFATGDMLHAATSGISAAMSALNGQTGNKQSGTMGSNAGALGIRKPYLIITRAISSMPAGFESIAGLPSTELVQLSSLSGYTSIRNVHLEGIPGTAEEIEEIKSLLESGVIF